jgi:hypothetical protein
MTVETDRDVSIHWQCGKCRSYRFMALKARPWAGMTIGLTPRLAVEAALEAEFLCKACGSRKGDVLGGGYLSDDDLIPF